MRLSTNEQQKMKIYIQEGCALTKPADRFQIMFEDCCEDKKEICDGCIHLDGCKEKLIIDQKILKYK